MSSLTPDLSMFYSSGSAGSAPSSPVNRRRSDKGDQSPGGQSVGGQVMRPASAGLGQVGSGPGSIHTSLPVYTSQGPTVSR